MQIEKLNAQCDVAALLKNLGVDSSGISILSSKTKVHLIYIRDLNVGGANILKQDALSISADLAVPRGTVLAQTPKVDCLLIATTKQLKLLSKKELAQPFGLKELALELESILNTVTPKQVEIMGVINTNNDSFFSGSRFIDSQAIQKIQKMIDDGASIIDIGAVSSAPLAHKVTPEEELKRIKPVLEIIKKKKLYEKVDFSIDSYEPLVIQEALESGFKIVNDITGLQNDEVCVICAKYDAKVVIMHMQGTPKTMQNNPSYENILSDIYSFFKERINKAESFGIKDIILDVGIGFGKSLENNLVLIKHLEHFLTLNKPLLIGASRKSMIDKISSSLPQNRLGGTLSLHLEAVKNGVSILRVHDVGEHIQAIKIQEALKNI
ncbi:MAG: dihydropteroate synthase [Sulfurimonas sp.]|nr:dihydropteroate synthase [Sulfurimonas sp.]